MCLFSPTQGSWLGRVAGQRRPETRVAETRIFARIEGGTQWLAYQMRIDTSSDVAMILPVPVAPNRGDDALSFVDLSGYGTFFEELEWLFPRPPVPRSGDAISEVPARAWIDPSRACGLVDVDSKVGRRLISGTHRNEDAWVDLAAGDGQPPEPRGVEPGGLRG